MVGVISEYDLIAKPEALTVGEAMTRDVISVMEDTDVDEVRFLLVNRKIKRVPVLRGHKLVGIVSRADLVREIALTWVCQVCGDHERGRNPPDHVPEVRHAERLRADGVPAAASAKGREIPTPHRARRAARSLGMRLRGRRVGCFRRVGSAPAAPRRSARCTHRAGG